MLLGSIFERFVAHSPLSVMARSLLEHALLPAELDTLFQRTAQRQYTRDLLFSTTVDLMSLVVTGNRSVRFASWRSCLPLEFVAYGYGSVVLSRMSSA